MKKGFSFVLIILSIFAISFVFSAAVEDVLHLNIQVTNSSNNDSILAGTFSFTFNISTSANCNNVVYTNSSTLTTDSRGTISYYLINTNLNYSDQYWLCYYRNGILINASKIAQVPYAFRARNVTLSGVDVDTNLVMGIYNITAGIGNFGAGLSLSGYKLNVVGNVNVTGNISIGGNYLCNTTDCFSFADFNATGSSGILSYSNIAFTNQSNVFTGIQNFSGGINVSNFFFVNGSNVGIGTTTPNTTLHIIGPGTPSTQYFATNTLAVFQTDTSNNYEYIDINANANQASGIRFDVGGNSQGYLIYRGASFVGGAPLDALTFGAGATTKMTLLSTGELGIGTTSPGSLLDVRGTTQINVSDNVVGLIVRARAQTGEYAKIVWSTDTQRIWAVGDTNYDPYMDLYQGDLATIGVHLMATGSSYFRGNVGIGTTTPSNTLDVRGSGNFSGTIYINNKTDISTFSSAYSGWNLSGTNLFTGSSSYYVGIGTSTPAYPLVINGTAGGIQISRWSGSPYILFTKEGVNVGQIRANTNQSIDITQPDGTNPFLSVNTSSGKVGIGTTSPDQILDVIGTIQARRTTATDVGGTLKIGHGAANWTLLGNWYVGYDLSFMNPSGANVLYFSQGTSAGSNVGIGTVSPVNSANYNTLTINGTTGGQIAFQSSGTAKGYIWNDATNFLLSPNTGSLIFAINAGANEAMRVNATNGYVGIGTTTPYSRLQILTDAATNGLSFFTASYDSAKQWGTRIYKQDTGSGIPLFIDTQSTGTWYNSMSIDHGQSNSHPALLTNYTTELAVTSGSVGIGTMNPQLKLDVGPMGGTQTATTGSLGLIRNNAPADLSPYTQARIIVYGGTGVDTGNWGYFGYGSDAVMRVIYSKTSSANPLAFGTSSAMDGTGTFTETMRITGGGNVGIGTTTLNNNARLSVGGVGPPDAGAVTAIYGNGSNANAYGVFGNGYVGVFGNGSTVGGGYGVYGISQQTGVGATGNYRGVDAYSNAGTAGYFSTTSGYALITSGGNVGIGTGSPGAKLDVNGSLFIKRGNANTIVGGMINSSGTDVSISTTGTFGNIVIPANTLTSGGQYLDIGYVFRRSTYTSNIDFGIKLNGQAIAAVQMTNGVAAGRLWLRVYYRTSTKAIAYGGYRLGVTSSDSVFEYDSDLANFNWAANQNLNISVDSNPSSETLTREIVSVTAN